MKEKLFTIPPPPIEHEFTVTSEMTFEQLKELLSAFELTFVLSDDKFKRLPEDVQKFENTK